MKRIVSFILVILMIVPALTGCGSPKATPAYTVDEDMIKSICELSTLECFFKNVAKSNKHGKGLKSDREFWCEYTGSIKVGIKFSEVALEQNGNELVITLPEAEVLSVSVNEFDKDSIIMSSGGLFSASVNANDVTQAIKTAQEQVKEEASKNKVILASARTKAKMLIQDYVSTLDELTGTTHTISWRYDNNLRDLIKVTENSQIDLRMIP